MPVQGELGIRRDLGNNSPYGCLGLYYEKQLALPWGDQLCHGTGDWDQTGKVCSFDLHGLTADGIVYKGGLQRWRQKVTTGFQQDRSLTGNWYVPRGHGLDEIQQQTMCSHFSNLIYDI
jgi:hypothetical protein